MPAANFARYVDVGCGTGLSTIAFADGLKRCKVRARMYGIDISDTQVATAQESNACEGLEYGYFLIVLIETLKSR